MWKRIITKTKFKRTIGIILIVIGLLALITPFTPGSWLIFIGLELIGIRILFWDKIKARFFIKDESASNGQKLDQKGNENQKNNSMIKRSPQRIVISILLVLLVAILIFLGTLITLFDVAKAPTGGTSEMQLPKGSPYVEGPTELPPSKVQ